MKLQLTLLAVITLLAISGPRAFALEVDSHKAIPSVVKTVFIADLEFKIPCSDDETSPQTLQLAELEIADTFYNQQIVDRVFHVFIALNSIRGPPQLVS